MIIHSGKLKKVKVRRQIRLLHIIEEKTENGKKEGLIMKASINAKGMEIAVIFKGDENDYLSLTDIAKYKIRILNWSNSTGLKKSQELMLLYLVLKNGFPQL